MVVILSLVGRILESDEPLRFSRIALTGIIGFKNPTYL